VVQAFDFARKTLNHREQKISHKVKGFIQTAPLPTNFESAGEQVIHVLHGMMHRRITPY
jgi:hypothetical protein